MFFALVFGVVAVFASKFFGPKNPNSVKLSTYESGMQPIGTAREDFQLNITW